jgi:hypothetical protein
LAGTCRGGWDTIAAVGDSGEAHGGRFWFSPAPRTGKHETSASESPRCFRAGKQKAACRAAFVWEETSVVDTVGRTTGGTGPRFRFCYPAGDRNRARAAGSTRTSSRRPQSQSPCAATTWLRSPGSCAEPCGRPESSPPAAWAMNRTIEARLRKLEARTPAKRMRYVLWMTSDQAEWERESAARITVHRRW